MGLYIVRLIALDHHGDVRAEPCSEDAGARLVLRLPARDAEFDNVANDDNADGVPRAGEARS
jgi:K+-sensing histidine kinase KdpD